MGGFPKSVDGVEWPSFGPRPTHSLRWGEMIVRLANCVRPGTMSRSWEYWMHGSRLSIKRWNLGDRWGIYCQIWIQAKAKPIQDREPNECRVLFSTRNPPWYNGTDRYSRSGSPVGEIGKQFEGIQSLGCNYLSLWLGVPMQTMSLGGNRGRLRNGGKLGVPPFSVLTLVIPLFVSLLYAISTNGLGKTWLSGCLKIQ